MWGVLFCVLAWERCGSTTSYDSAPVSPVCPTMLGFSLTPTQCRQGWRSRCCSSCAPNIFRFFALENVLGVKMNLESSTVPLKYARALSRADPMGVFPHVSREIASHLTNRTTSEWCYRLLRNTITDEIWAHCIMSACRSTSASAGASGGKMKGCAVCRSQLFFQQHRQILPYLYLQQQEGGEGLIRLESKALLLCLQVADCYHQYVYRGKRSFRPLGWRDFWFFLKTPAHTAKESNASHLFKFCLVHIIMLICQGPCIKTHSSRTGLSPFLLACQRLHVKFRFCAETVQICWGNNVSGIGLQQRGALKVVKGFRENLMITVMIMGTENLHVQF